MTVIALWASELFRARAASIMNGPWMAQCPPADGAKKLMKKELTSPKKGRVSAVATSVNSLEMLTTSPD